MDEFSFIQLSPGGLLWPEETLEMNNQSAFIKYTNQPIEGMIQENISNPSNVNKRMIEFLKRNYTPPPMLENKVKQRGSGHKRAIKERIRRELHRQHYQALLKLLPLETKNDKKSILEMAAKKIEELEKHKEELERSSNEMKIILGSRKNEEALLEKAEIKLKVSNPASGIDSMLEVLKCLKYTNSTATAIQSNFSKHEFSALLRIETQIRAADVEKEVQRALYEVERKFRHQFEDN